MSSIKIVCRRDVSVDRKPGEKRKDLVGADLQIESSQLFMNTEKFFISVKETLGKYFDSIEKK